MDIYTILLSVMIAMLSDRILELEISKTFRIRLRARRIRRFKIKTDYDKKISELAASQLPYLYSVLEILQRERAHAITHGLGFVKYGELNKTINEISRLESHRFSGS